jgi:hypothetical protein
VAEPDEADHSRVIAEAICEVFSGLCKVVDADRFGPLSPSDGAPLRSSLRQLVELTPDFRGWASPGVDLSIIGEVARELEVVLEGGIASPPNPRIGDLASHFANAMGCDVFPPR